MSEKRCERSVSMKEATPSVPPFPVLPKGARWERFLAFTEPLLPLDFHELSAHLCPWREESALAQYMSFLALEEATLLVTDRPRSKDLSSDPWMRFFPHLLGSASQKNLNLPKVWVLSATFPGRSLSSVWYIAVEKFQAETHPGWWMCEAQRSSKRTVEGQELARLFATLLPSSIARKAENSLIQDLSYLKITKSLRSPPRKILSPRLFHQSSQRLQRLTTKRQLLADILKGCEVSRLFLPLIPHGLQLSPRQDRDQSIEDILLSLDLNNSLGRRVVDSVLREARTLPVLGQDLRDIEKIWRHLCRAEEAYRNEAA
jgi:hypothetical protein